MATKVLSLVNNRLKFLYRKQKLLTLLLRCLLCNSLIQPHHDYACSAWYPSLNKRLSKKIQTFQNKCIRCCLNLDNKAHVGINKFIEINWLPTKEKVAQCICVNILKFFNKMSPQYILKNFHLSHSLVRQPGSERAIKVGFCSTHQPEKTFTMVGQTYHGSLKFSQLSSSRVVQFRENH